jgi:quercetin dioxygenase-like cupin family protein
MGAVLHLPGEGEKIGGQSSVTIKATGEDTAGSFYLGEVVLEARFVGPPPHVHERLHDMFYILEGTLTLRVADETVDLRPVPSPVSHPGSCTRLAIAPTGRCGPSTSTRPLGGRATCVT